MNEMQKIEITDEFITLGQMLKLTNLFDSGGFIKVFLKETGVYVNDELEHRRGRKLYPRDKIMIDTDNVFVIHREK